MKKNRAGDKVYPVATRNGLVTVGKLAVDYDRHVTRIYVWLREAKAKRKRYPGDRNVYYDPTVLSKYLNTPKGGRP